MSDFTIGTRRPTPVQTGSNPFEPSVINNVSEAKNSLENNNEPGSHSPSEPVQTSSNTPETEWLAVNDAAEYCLSRGLVRTPKTVRKWAERSYNKSDGDVLSRREDTVWGRYRWSIEKNSLERKIEDELRREGSNQGEPVRTGSNPSNQSSKDFSVPKIAQVFEPVRTGSNDRDLPATDEGLEIKAEPSSNSSELVRTGSNDEPAGNRQVGDAKIEIARLQAEVAGLLEQRKADAEQIAFLRDEVVAARAQRSDVVKISERTLQALETISLSGKMAIEVEKNPTAKIVPSHEGEVVPNTPTRPQ